MPVPIWAGHYIGMPFADKGRERSGLDCWGLVRLVMQEQFGIALPSHTGEYQRATELDKIPALIDRESRKWFPVPAGSEVLADVIVLRYRGAPMHVGMVLGDGQMLHIEQNVNSLIEKYTGSRWATKVSGFYRHAATNAK